MKNQNPLKEDIYSLEINFSNFHILLTAACCPKRDFYNLHTHTLENATDFCTVLCLLELGTKTQQNSHRKAANLVPLGVKSLYCTLKFFFLHTKKFVLHTKKKSFVLQKIAFVLKKIALRYSYFLRFWHTFWAFSTLSRWYAAVMKPVKNLSSLITSNKYYYMFQRTS